MRNKRNIYVIYFENTEGKYMPGTMNGEGGFFLTLKAARTELRTIKYLDPEQKFKIVKYQEV
jgi:hypothetical protein